MRGPLGPVISVCFDSNVDSKFSDRGLSTMVEPSLPEITRISFPSLLSEG